jgi:hypothetical protein
MIISYLKLSPVLKLSKSSQEKIFLPELNFDSLFFYTSPFQQHTNKNSFLGTT